jgi:hypothetical protein
MGDFFQLSLFYTTVSANYKLGVIDVKERNQPLLQALEMARVWCTSGQLLAKYKMFLDKARSDEVLDTLENDTIENLAREIQMENTDFIKKIQNNAKL